MLGVADLHMHGCMDDSPSKNVVLSVKQLASISFALDGRLIHLRSQLKALGGKHADTESLIEHANSALAAVEAAL